MALKIQAEFFKTIIQIDDISGHFLRQLYYYRDITGQAKYPLTRTTKEAQVEYQ